MFRAALAACLLLSACSATPPPGAELPGDRPELSQAEAAACIARGGQVAVGGLLGGRFCAERLADAGQACTRAGDCIGRCEAETRTCQTHANPFGCHSMLDAEGNPVTLCAD